jgi:hypothetical protein
MRQRVANQGGTVQKKRHGDKGTVGTENRLKRLYLKEEKIYASGQKPWNLPRMIGVVRLGRPQNRRLSDDPIRG